MAAFEIDDLFEEILDIQDEAEETRENLNIDYIIEKISPNKICNNKFNEVYDNLNQSEADDRLMESILEHGLLENIVVTPNNSPYNTSYLDSGCEYRLISGHRRLNAIKRIIREKGYEVSKPFMMIAVKIEKYNSDEEELLALNSYNLHSRTLSAEDKLMILSDIRNKLDKIIGDKEPTEKQKLIKKELRSYKSIFEGMATATKARYMAISANSNPKIVNLINDGFTIHQLAKISNFPGSNYHPLHALLSEEKQIELKELLDGVGDIQSEVLNAVDFLKENNMWNNEVNMKNWRNYIINNFVSPVHMCLITTKSNCSAYNLATTVKDKENAKIKIKRQIKNINDLIIKFRNGYTTGNLENIKKNHEDKSVVEKFETDFKKIDNKDEMIKVLKSIIKQACNSEVITSEKAVEIMNLL